MDPYEPRNYQIFSQIKNVKVAKNIYFFKKKVAVKGKHKYFFFETNICKSIKSLINYEYFILFANEYMLRGI